MNERDAAQDGPNTHNFITYHGTVYTVVCYLDLVGTMHLFHVPREVADTLTKPLHTEIERLREALEEVAQCPGLVAKAHRIAVAALTPKPTSGKDSP